MEQLPDKKGVLVPRQGSDVILLEDLDSDIKDLEQKISDEQQKINVNIDANNIFQANIDSYIPELDNKKALRKSITQTFPDIEKEVYPDELADVAEPVQI